VHTEVLANPQVLHIRTEEDVTQMGRELIETLTQYALVRMTLTVWEGLPVHIHEDRMACNLSDASSTNAKFSIC
jgi:hypothetical protein